MGVFAAVCFLTVKETATILKHREKRVSTFDSVQDLMLTSSGVNGSNGCSYPGSVALVEVCTSVAVPGTPFTVEATLVVAIVVVVRVEAERASLG